MAARTRSRVGLATDVRPLTTLDTVAGLTPALAATSAMVGIVPLRAGG